MGKGFKNKADNAALDFIDTSAASIVPEELETTTEASATSAVQPRVSHDENQKKEPKSKRLQLLIRPSTYDAIKNKSDQTGESVNELINKALEEAFL